MALVIDNKYEHGETVYLKTDKDQTPRIVFCIKCFKNETLYELACGERASTHYEFEISKEINYVINT